MGIGQNSKLRLKAWFSHPLSHNHGTWLRTSYSARTQIIFHSLFQPRELQVTIEQLRYETGAQQRRHTAESAAQRQRITVLEGQVAEAQREADTFHQASVENNSELTGLRNQVTGETFSFLLAFAFGLIQ